MLPVGSGCQGVFCHRPNIIALAVPCERVGFSIKCDGTSTASKPMSATNGPLLLFLGKKEHQTWFIYWKTFLPGRHIVTDKCATFGFSFRKRNTKSSTFVADNSPRGSRAQNSEIAAVRCANCPRQMDSFGVSFSKRNTKSSTFCLRQCDARGEMSPDKWPTFDVPFCPRNSKRGPFVGRHFASPDSLWGDVWGAERGAQRPHRSPEAGSATSPSLA